MRHYIRREVRGGFTLIEVLLVVAILGILAAIVAVKTSGHTDKARRQSAWTQIEALKTACSTLEIDLGRWPKNLEELVLEGDEKWPGPYLESEEVPNDPWGNPYHYEIKDKRIRITSPGPDGQLGTEDDLWK